MKKWLTGFFCVALIGLCACGTGEELPETPIDAGRAFISAIYNGNFKKARKLVVPGSPHTELLETAIEKDFRSRDGFQKDALSKASIQIMKIEAIDSLKTEVHFMNAYNGKPATLDVIKMDGTWKIGLEHFQP